MPHKEHTAARTTSRDAGPLPCPKPRTARLGEIHQDVDGSVAAVDAHPREEPRPLLLDKDGPLVNGGSPVPGAAEALAELEARGHRMVVLSNTTTKSARQVTHDLQQAGFQLTEDQVVTAASMTARYLHDIYPGATIGWLGEGNPFEPSDGLTFAADGETPDVVVTGGNGPSVSFERVNQALRWVSGGAPLVSMHRNLIWRGPDGLALDIGAIVTAIESATGRKASLMGKPSPAAFACGLERLGADPQSAVMVGDDLEHDVLAAQKLGLRGVLVLTGKTSAGDLTAKRAPVDHVLRSIAELPQLLLELTTTTDTDNNTNNSEVSR